MPSTLELFKESINVLNKARAEGKGEPQAQAAAQKLCDTLNAELKTQLFTELTAETVVNPIMTALTQGFFDQYSLVEKAIKGSTSKEWGYNKKDAVIPMQELEKSTTRKLSVDPSYPIKAEKAAEQLAAKCALDVGDDMEEFHRYYKLSKEAKAMGTADPLSMESLTTLIQNLLAAMCPGWKININKYDANFLFYTAFGKGKGKAGIRVPKTRTVLEQIQRLAYVRLNGAKFTLDFKKYTDDELKAQVVAAVTPAPTPQITPSGESVEGNGELAPIVVDKPATPEKSKSRGRGKGKEKVA
jgi:hypothetical protein